MTVTDRAFPAALSDLKLRVSLPDGTSLPCTVTLPAPTCNLSLTSGVTYDLFVIAAADTTALEGLYSLKIAGISPLTSVPYAATIPVGGLSQSLNAVVLSAGNISLRFNDLNYPAALAAMKALVTQNGEVLQQFTTAGNAAAVPVVAGTVQIFASAAPDAARGEGAYAVFVSDNAGATLLDNAVPVVDSTHLGYSFSKPLSAAGSYQFIVTDYLLPKPIAVLDALAEQQGGVLGSGAGANIFVSAQNGPLNMIAFAAVPAAGDSGLFGIDLLGPGSGGTVFQTTQGVGALLQTVDIVAVAGKYVAQLTDLGFPANFGQLRLIGTGNRQVLAQLAIDQQSRTGKVVFDVPSAGAYVINVLAQVGSGEHYGLYGFTLATAPPAPVVTLTSSVSNVNVGEHATLTWTSTDAAGCTASDGWSGTLAATGSKDVGALSATATFTISCTGDGGTGMASALVRVTQPMSGGGGGAMNSAALLTLALASIWIVRRR